MLCTYSVRWSPSGQNRSRKGADGGYIQEPKPNARKIRAALLHQGGPVYLARNERKTFFAVLKLGKFRLHRSVTSIGAGWSLSPRRWHQQRKPFPEGGWRYNWPTQAFESRQTI